MRTQFVFTGTGTLGDLLPMLTLARALLARGYECHVLGNDAAAPFASEQGVPFTPIAPARANDLATVEENFERHVFPSYAPTFDFIERALRRSSRIVVVNSEHHAASTLMCERRGLPLCRLVLTPFRMRSLLAPRWPWKAKLSGPFEHSFRRCALPALYERRYRHSFILHHLNSQRKRVGLAPIDTLRALEPLVDHHVCLFPEWYCPRAADWPKRLDVVGFPLPEPRGSLPQRLLELIAHEGAPLVFTPGTGVRDIAAFFREARRACELMNRPAVFLSPHLDRDAEDRGRVLGFDYLDLGLLLRRAALLVHHGGIGTTARAIEAKVPQIICPRAYDQPDNAERVTSLGVGACLEPNAWAAAALARTATVLLGASGLRERLDALGDSVRASNAITRAADVIIDRFTGQPRAEPSVARRYGDPPRSVMSRHCPPTRRSPLPQHLP